VDEGTDGRTAARTGLYDTGLGGTTCRPQLPISKAIRTPVRFVGTDEC